MVIKVIDASLSRKTTGTRRGLAVDVLAWRKQARPEGRAVLAWFWARQAGAWRRRAARHGHHEPPPGRGAR